MEEQLKKLKAEMLKGELSNFEFNNEMKRNVVKRFGKQKSAYRFRKLIPTVLSVAFLIFFSMGIYWLVDSHNSGQPGDTPEVEETPIVDTPDSPQIAEFDEGMATALLDRYNDTMELVLENAKDQPEFKFKSFSEEEDIYELFNDFMAKELIEKLFNGRIEKSQDGLHLISTEKLFSYKKGIPFTLKKMSETDYQFIQTQEYEDGRVLKLSASFGFNSGTWKITSLGSEELSAPQLEEQGAVDLLNRYNTVRKAAFEDSLDQPDYKFRSYKTKEEFYELFLGFMTRAAIEPTLSIRLEEKNGSLFLLPMDPVRSFWPESPYVFKKASEGEYVLTQIQEGDMNGRRKLTVTFKNLDDTWKIVSIKTEAISGNWLSQIDASSLLREYHVTLENVFADAIDQQDKKFKSYQSLEEMNKEFEGLATQKFLNTHLSEYVTERTDGVYLIAEREPVVFSDDHLSKLERLNDQEYTLTQQQDNNIIYIATFKLIDDKWIIDDMKVTEAN